MVRRALVPSNLMRIGIVVMVGVGVTLLSAACGGQDHTEAGQDEDEERCGGTASNPDYGCRVNRVPPFEVVLTGGMRDLGIERLEVSAADRDVVPVVGVEPSGRRLRAEVRVGLAGRIWLNRLEVEVDYIDDDREVQMHLGDSHFDNTGIGAPAPPPTVFEPLPPNGIFPGEEPGPCTGTMPYDPAAPAYSGPGPHPVALSSVNVGDDYRIAATGLGGSLGPWLAETGPGEGGVYSGSQLLVCYEAVLTPGAASIGACEYPATDTQAYARLEVVPATYTFAVYESRTAALVDTFTLPGTASAEESCPHMTFYTEITQVAQGVDEDALAERMRPLVENPR